MSWTDIFPVLDDDLLDRYRAGVTDAERAEFEEWFGVGEVFKTQDCKTQDTREEMGLEVGSGAVGAGGIDD
jgi:hypothetical protein